MAQDLVLVAICRAPVRAPFNVRYAEALLLAAIHIYAALAEMRILGAIGTALFAEVLTASNRVNLLYASVFKRTMLVGCAGRIVDAGASYLVIATVHGTYYRARPFPFYAFVFLPTSVFVVVDSARD